MRLVLKRSGRPALTVDTDDTHLAGDAMAFLEQILHRSAAHAGAYNLEVHVSPDDEAVIARDSEARAAQTKVGKK